MMTTYKRFWTHYADFSGRTSRSDFWLAFFWNFLFSIPFWIYIIVSILQSSDQVILYSLETSHNLSYILAIGLLFLYYFIIFVPSQAIVIRRLRDAGFHWSLSFLNLAPILIYLLTALDFFVFVWIAGVAALLVLLMMKTSEPLPVAVASEQLGLGQTDRLVVENQGSGTGFEEIPSFVAAPSVSSEPTPLEKKLAEEARVEG